MSFAFRLLLHSLEIATVLISEAEAPQTSDNSLETHLGLPGSLTAPLQDGLQSPFI